MWLKEKSLSLDPANTIMSKFEQSTDSLNDALGKKPEDSKSTEAKSEDVMANLERNFNDLSKVETQESDESSENKEKSDPNPPETEKNLGKSEKAEAVFSPFPDKKDRPQGLTSGDAMRNIVDQLGLSSDKTSKLVNDILNSNLTTTDRKALAARSPEGTAAVRIAYKIEAVLGQVNGNSEAILGRAQKIVVGETGQENSLIVETYAQQVAEQLNKGLPPKEAVAYVLVNQMATSFVEGLQENSVRLG